MSIKRNQVVDPMIKRGSSLRREDRRHLVNDLQSLLVGLEKTANEVRRLPLQLVDAKSGDSLLDLVSEVAAASNGLLTVVKADCHRLSGLLKRVSRRLELEFNGELDDD